MGYRGRRSKEIDSFLELILEDFKTGKRSVEEALNEIRNFLGRQYLTKEFISKRVKVECLCCGNELRIVQSDYQDNKHKQFFCDVKCRTKFRNSVFNQTQELVWDCLLSNGVLTTKEVADNLQKPFTTIADSLKKINRMGLIFSKSRGKNRFWYVDIKKNLD